MAATIRPHFLIGCKVNECDHCAENKSFISVPSNKTVSDVFDRVHEASDAWENCKLYTFKTECHKGWWKVVGGWVRGGVGGEGCGVRNFS